MEKYFLGSNTKSGFKGFYDTSTAEMDRVYLIKGGAGTGKSSLIKKVLKRGIEEGYRCEAWHCSGDPSSLDGVYIFDLDVAVIDATLPHAVEPTIPVVKDNIINLLQYADKQKLAGYRSVIEKLSNNKKECYRCGYEHLNIAYCHLAQNIRCVSSSMNKALIVSKAKEFAMDILTELKCLNGDLADEKYCSDGYEIGGKIERKGAIRGRVSKRFFRAITPDGIVVYDDFLQGKNIWHIKGEVASVDLFLKTALDVVMNGDNEDKPSITIFYNPLDVAVIDGFMIGDTAVVCDIMKADGVMVYDLNWYEGDFDKYAVSRGRVKMKEEIDVAVDYFAKARGVHLGIERYYISAMDFDGINRLTDKLLEEIF